LSKIKITYIISNIDKAISFEWIVENLNSSKFELSFILLNKSESHLFKWLKKQKINTYAIQHSGKRNYFTSFLKVFLILLKIKPEIVHTHLFDANLIGLTTAKILNIKKRIYTRHHSTYHHDNFPKTVKYDLWANLIATKIVAISKNVETILVEREQINNDKITLIHHGFELKNFQSIKKRDVINLKNKYQINDNEYPVIGVIARYIKWKGIEYIITAFKQILKEFPKAKLILANASGPDEKQIKDLLKQLPKANFIEIKFESNLFALYHLFDIYIHTPINSEIEAYGQTYVEALAAGVPSIFTLSGVANEFIKNGENALVVPYNNSKEIEKSINYLLKKPQKSKELIENGIKSVQQFNLDLFINKLEKLYSK
tara:strand:- start:39 stop:1157 length:1119 start_codon:yes stop_codon:yes gene_type:complete